MKESKELSQPEFEYHCTKITNNLSKRLKGFQNGKREEKNDWDICIITPIKLVSISVTLP